MPLYYMLSRPALDGTFPPADGPIVAPVVYSFSQQLVENGIYHYAELQYIEPLDFVTIWKYELFPVDVVEAAHYRFYLAADRDPEEQSEMENDYLSQPDEWLHANVRRDSLCTMALTIRES
jgi:hypothetical protein